jgi:hypothetical protein
MKSNWIACTSFIASSMLLPGTVLAQLDASGAPADRTVAKQESVANVKQVGLNDAQLAEANARLELAKVLVARVESDAIANRLSEGWKGDAMRALLPLQSGQLKALAADRSSITYAGLVRSAKKAATLPATAETKLLGDNTQDLVFYPITPCRNVDTRNAGGPIAAGTFRDFNADSAGSQGGTPGCFVVPLVDASAWALNITVINMNTTGFVAVRSVGSSALTSLVNYTGPGQQVNNFVIVNNSRASAVNEYEVYAASTVDVIVDLFGYFLPPNKTPLDCTDVRTDLTANTGGSFQFERSSCATGYTLTGGGCLGSTSFTFGNLVYSGPDGASSTSTWLCTWVNNGVANQAVATVATCCRTPGR